MLEQRLPPLNVLPLHPKRRTTLFPVQLYSPSKNRTVSRTPKSSVVVGGFSGKMNYLWRKVNDRRDMYRPYNDLRTPILCTRAYRQHVRGHPPRGQTCSLQNGHGVKADAAAAGDNRNGDSFLLLTSEIGNPREWLDITTNSNENIYFPNAEKSSFSFVIV